jgi:hypothetical protein
MIDMNKHSSVGDQMLPEDRVAELAETFRLMGDPSRLKIILACLAAPICVGDIAERAGLSLSLASHHLRLLRAAPASCAPSGMESRCSIPPRMSMWPACFAIWWPMSTKPANLLTWRKARDRCRGLYY